MKMRVMVMARIFPIDVEIQLTIYKEGDCEKFKLRNCYGWGWIYMFYLVWWRLDWWILIYLRLVCCMLIGCMLIGYMLYI